MTIVAERMRIVCSWCGSAHVSRDAWASWDVAAQDWVLGAVFDAVLDAVLGFDGCTKTCRPEMYGW